jgi:hypothetical protein
MYLKIGFMLLPLIYPFKQTGSMQAFRVGDRVPSGTSVMKH